VELAAPDKQSEKDKPAKPARKSALKKETA